jgi:hypothetical protein
MNLLSRVFPYPSSAGKWENAAHGERFIAVNVRWDAKG